ncbi:MAG: 3-deoxy-8-phosphooctulonate synthase [Candidatus Omnitrophica bacterium]|nr:3-deoxy-8-phosphooctulonate synthase [Candidatus Omnitrophota bacterium]MCF7893840.1 3-deoxy-8-phosphooctulonate synthase [Candidatus Omnitrophota bacterium]
MKELIIIAGPCVIEDEKTTTEIASYLKDNLSDLPIKLIFKASFDKANRTSVDSYRGPGLKAGLEILKNIKEKTNLPILTDIHCCQQIKDVEKVADIIQIPAFLSRQTDLIVEAAKTKKTINIKKGQFISPQSTRYILKKIESTGNKNILITERGFCFGYNNLVVDFRSFLIMKEFGYPVIFDATHSLQRPSAESGISGGDSQFVKPLSLAAAAAGVDGFFLEVHPRPEKALSDRFTTYKLNKIKDLIKKILSIKKIVD